MNLSKTEEQSSRRNCTRLSLAERMGTGSVPQIITTLVSPIAFTVHSHDHWLPSVGRTPPWALPLCSPKPRQQPLTPLCQLTEEETGAQRPRALAHGHRFNAGSSGCWAQCSQTQSHRSSTWWLPWSPGKPNTSARGTLGERRLCLLNNPNCTWKQATLKNWGGCFLSFFSLHTPGSLDTCFCIFSGGGKIDSLYEIYLGRLGGC